MLTSPSSKFEFLRELKVSLSINGNYIHYTYTSGRKWEDDMCKSLELSKAQWSNKTETSAQIQPL